MAGWILVYGATGYTGTLIAELALQRGLPIVVAGRHRARVEALAARLGSEGRTVSLDDPAGLDAALTGVAAVLHCAGPFIRTAAPMVEACLRSRTHYLDITAEIPVFEALARRDPEARAAGVMLLPGVGFGVVPSDCLAAHLQRRLPTARRLALAFDSVRGGPSRGTALTFLEHAGRAGMVRRAGILTRVPVAWKTRLIDFGTGPVPAISAPWGDIATAYHTTGIPEIEAYVALPPALRPLRPVLPPLAAVLRTRAVRALLRAAIRRVRPGPTPEQRARSRSLVWGEAEDGEGRRAVARLRGPNVYTFTALAALRAAEKVLAGHPVPGFQTPARAYGADFVMEIEGVERVDC